MQIEFAMFLQDQKKKKKNSQKQFFLFFNFLKTLAKHPYFYKTQENCLFFVFNLKIILKTSFGKYSQTDPWLFLTLYNIDKRAMKIVNQY